MEHPIADKVYFLPAVKNSEAISVAKINYCP